MVLVLDFSVLGSESRDLGFWGSGVLGFWGFGYADGTGLLYCSIPKVACTTLRLWMRRLGKMSGRRVGGSNHLET